MNNNAELNTNSINNDNNFGNNNLSNVNQNYGIQFQFENEQKLINLKKDLFVLSNKFIKYLWEWIIAGLVFAIIGIIMLFSSISTENINTTLYNMGTTILVTTLISDLVCLIIYYVKMVDIFQKINSLIAITTNYEANYNSYKTFFVIGFFAILFGLLVIFPLIACYRMKKDFNNVK